MSVLGSSSSSGLHVHCCRRSHRSAQQRTRYERCSRSTLCLAIHASFRLVFLASSPKATYQVIALMDKKCLDCYSGGSYTPAPRENDDNFDLHRLHCFRHCYISSALPAKRRVWQSAGQDRICLGFLLSRVRHLDVLFHA